MRFPSAKTTLTIIITVAYTLILTTLFASLMNANYKVVFPSFGTIRVVGFEIYGGNLTTTDGNYQLDWGITYVGSSTNRSFHIRSKSNVNTKMDLAPVNYNFKNAEGQTLQLPMTNPIKLTPDYNGTFVPDQEIYLTLTLEIPYKQDFVEYLVKNRIKTFFFDAMIQPSEV